MKFLRILDCLRSDYSDNCKIQDNAVLYGVNNQPPPLAKHIVFNPMPPIAIDDIVSNYKLDFPTELLKFYSKTNGADFFWTLCSLEKSKIQIPFCLFSIYGIPLTHDRKHIEPYNIVIEDLNRPNGVPECWLKFGSYYMPDNLSIRHDLFVDTIQNTVFAVNHEQAECCIMKTWDSIDICLCSIFEFLSAGQGDRSLVTD